MSCSWAASFSFCFILALASRGNQSCKKFNSAQSTFAFTSRKRYRREKKGVLTSIGSEHCFCSAHRTVALASFLHLDKTSNTEQMPTHQPNGLESDTRTYQARVIINVRYDGEQGLSNGLHENPGQSARGRLW